MVLLRFERVMWPHANATGSRVWLLGVIFAITQSAHYAY
jgi:hypothetical protein